MLKQRFTEFLDGDDTLRIYRGDRLIFSSPEERLRPLLEYLAKPGSRSQSVTVFDKVMGNAAALLAVKAGAGEVWSPWAAGWP